MFAQEFPGSNEHVVQNPDYSGAQEIGRAHV